MPHCLLCQQMGADEHKKLRIGTFPVLNIFGISSMIYFSCLLDRSLINA